MTFLTGLLVGIGLSILIIPFIFLIAIKRKERKLRKYIQNEILHGRFLTPLDKKDYDYKNWKDLIDVDRAEENLSELADKIFKRGKFTQVDSDDN